MKLECYFTGESLADQESRREYAAELQLFSELIDLYDELARTVNAGSREELPAHLFLVVRRQLYGVVSQLLRRRVPDAEVLTRKAVEATGAAQLVWSKPSLAQVFVDAYRHTGTLAPDDPKRFYPSKPYREEFKTERLFGQSGDGWKFLKLVYSLLSTVSAHAGLGATVGHVLTDSAITGNPFSADAEVKTAWHLLLKVYWVIWRVFFRMLSPTANATSVQQLSAQTQAWSVRFSAAAQRSREQDDCLAEDPIGNSV